MKKNKKEKYVDDGHTIYNMDVDGMPHRKRHNNDDNFSLTKNEKENIIWCNIAFANNYLS